MPWKFIQYTCCLAMKLLSCFYDYNYNMYSIEILNYWSVFVNAMCNHNCIMHIDSQHYLNCIPHRNVLIVLHIDRPYKQILHAACAKPCYA